VSVLTPQGNKEAHDTLDRNLSRRFVIIFPLYFLPKLLIAHLSSLLWLRLLIPVSQSTGEAGIGMAGGISFTKHWLSFDNSYFQPSSHRLDLSQTEVEVDDLLLLPTDKTLFLSPEFKQYSELYGRDEKIFFLDYSQAHKKMSELGVKWMAMGSSAENNQGISLDLDLSNELCL
jgi:hypothetical protein